MHKSAVGIIFAGICLALTTTGIVRADSVSSPAPAGQASKAQSPEDVFRSKGLTHLGFWLILCDEEDIHDNIRALRAAKMSIRDDVVARRDSTVALNQAHRNLDQLEAELKTTEDQLTQSINNPVQLDNKNVEPYNNWVNTNNKLQAKRDSLIEDIHKQERELDELQKRDATIKDSRSRYVNMAMDMGSKAESVAAAYARLAKDTELAAAIDQYNQTAQPRARLGPSGRFLDDLQFIRQCAKEVLSSPVPVESAGGVDCVSAVLNETVTATMVWDSGAAMVTLSAATASAAGLQPTDKDESIDLTVADGRKVTAKVMTLDSIRLAGFTVKNVECAVLPPDYHGTDDLLGDTFQKHFVCRLDQQTRQLQLTPIDSSVTQGPVVGPLPKPQPKPVAAAAFNGDLLSTMQGDTSRLDNGAIVLQGHERITTARTFSPPVKLTIIAQTDSTNLRISYAADQIIFNWEMNQDQLRIDGGPAGGRHTDRAGKIPTNQWVKVEIIVLPDSMKILVDGQQRFLTQADFSHVNQGLSIFPAAGSVVKVKSVVAK
jgi:clan AA aspartic protease (TIGR02281 family)